MKLNTCQAFHDPVAAQPPPGQHPVNRCTGGVSHWAVSPPRAFPNAVVVAVCHHHGTRLRVHGWTVTAMPAHERTAAR